MPKQIFQRPAPLKLGKFGNQKSAPFGPGSKPQKPPKLAKTGKKPSKPAK